MKKKSLLIFFLFMLCAFCICGDTAMDVAGTATTLSEKSINTGAFTGTPNLIVDLRGGKTVAATTYVGTLTTLTDDGYTAVKEGNTYKQIRVVGDVNGDKEVTVLDALMILKAILNDSTLENADMNGDGVLSLVDVMRVLKLATK